MPVVKSIDGQTPRRTAGRRMKLADPTTYGTPGTRRIDAANTLVPFAAEVWDIMAREGCYGAVRVKNTTGVGWVKGSMLQPKAAGLTAIVAANASSNPVAGSSVAITITPTGFEVGMIVEITYVENAVTYAQRAIITAVGGSSITVDFLEFSCTTPTVTSLPAQEAALADADGVNLAAWVCDAAIADGAYGWAFGAVEVIGFDTSGASAAEALVYLSATAGGWTTTAPTGSDQVQQLIGQVIVKHASSGSIRFYPAARLVKKVGSSFFQSGVLATPAWGHQDYTANATLTSADENIALTNTGASGEVDLTLPAAVAGVGPMRMMLTVAQVFKYLAAGTDKIFRGQSVPAGGTHLYSSQLYATITLHCPKTGVWVVVGEPMGDWSLG